MHEATLVVAVAVVVAAALTASVLRRQRREGFGGSGVTVVKRCRPKRGGTAAADPDYVGSSKRRTTTFGRACDVYFTNNVEACDKGAYEVPKAVLRERRARGDATVDAVLQDYDLMPAAHVCKASFNDWVQADDAPRIVATPEDGGQRGSPSHWAFCVVPPTADQKADLAALDKNVVRASSERVRLLGGKTGERVEFVSLDAGGVMKQACKLRRANANEDTLKWARSLADTVQARIDMMPGPNEGVAGKLTFHRISPEDAKMLPVRIDTDEAIDGFASLFETRVAAGGRLEATPHRTVVATRYRFAPPPCADGVQEVVESRTIAMPAALRAALGGDAAAVLVGSGVAAATNTLPLLRKARTKALDAYESQLAKARFERKAYLDAITRSGGWNNGIARWFMAVASPLLPVI